LVKIGLPDSLQFILLPIPPNGRIIRGIIFVVRVNAVDIDVE